MHSKLPRVIEFLPLPCRSGVTEYIPLLKPEDLDNFKFKQDGEIYGKRSKGDRKRNPRWRRQ